MLNAAVAVAVESLYSAMCDCQALHPDENDSLSAGAFLVTLLFVSLYYFVYVISLYVSH